MSNNTEALRPEVARESASILIIVAARLVRLECLTPLHTLSELNQKTIGTRALRDAIDRVEESLLREAGKIRDGHDCLSRKLRESESALEQSQQRVAELESRQLSVKLPNKIMGWGDDDCWNNAIDECAAAIIRAGGTVQRDE